MTDEPTDQKQSQTSNSPESCCAGCSQHDSCIQVWSAPNKGPLTPIGVVLASVLAFLVPLLAAICGGVLARTYLPSSQNITLGQVACVVGGFVVGGLLAWLAVPLIRKRFHE